MKRTWKYENLQRTVLYTLSHKLGTRHARDQLISTPDCFENSLCLILPPLSLEAGEKEKAKTNLVIDLDLESLTPDLEKKKFPNGKHLIPSRVQFRNEVCGVCKITYCSMD